MPAVARALPWLAVALLLCHLPLAGADRTLTYVDLVNRMVDLERLAVLPADGETCAQWSSWDRASKYDAESGKYLHWDANDDGPAFIRKEGDQIVMAEMEGPGCIWRTWSALAQDGHVKIYLDGSDQPAVDLPFKNYFTGDTAPLNYPMLSYDLGAMGCRGHNLYFPIPYQKSCKIVADPGWGRYYQFVYTTYPQGTRLPTFKAALSEEEAAALARVNRFFAESLGSDPAGERPGQRVESGAADIPAGETVSLELEGPRAITALRCKAEFAGREDEMAAARQLVLRITWDDQPKPAVWCPVGDFFGTAPGVNLYRSLATGIGEEGAYALWYMPFRTRARIEVVNEGSKNRRIEFEVAHAPLSQPVDELGYFHSKWHRDVHELSEDRWPDWVMLRTHGHGRFCGVMLHVWNPQGGWWGEGDEKFFVDGEKYPSTFGTGSEDYFGYAWCHPGLFQRAYHGQTMTQNNQGHQSVFRWHVIDNVPFHKAFEAAIEKYYKTGEKGTEYACTVNWYLAPGGEDPYEPVPVEKRHNYYAQRPLRAGGFDVLEKSGGNVQTQKLTQFPGGKWQNDDHLWWTGANPGDKLVLSLPVKQAGSQEVCVVLTKARDYGMVQFYLDGKKAGDPIDLYNPEVVPTEPISLGVHDLSEGEHKLGVEIVGANDKAVKSYMFGIDHVVFRVK
ncbi:MAG: DUF2961 domain-containing protein [Pirellulales bacterium]|nr:DUF2961 domain-containing protein [Pirellulales bacterium]